jgi:hypothetical protein
MSAAEPGLGRMTTGAGSANGWLREWVFKELARPLR